MMNNFPKGPSGAPLHTLPKLYDVPVGFVNPPPSFWSVHCFICGRIRVAVAWYRMFLLSLHYLFSSAIKRVVVIVDWGTRDPTSPHCTTGRRFPESSMSPCSPQQTNNQQHKKTMFYHPCDFLLYYFTNFHDILYRKVLIRKVQATPLCLANQYYFGILCAHLT